MSDVTQLLASIEQGESAAAEKLLPLIYDELRKLAAAKLSLENPGHTLQATALVHEAYLRLVGGGGTGGLGLGAGEGVAGRRNLEPAMWDGRGHFFAAAAEAMRRILIDQARRKARLKRGGEIERVELDEVEISLAGPSDDVLALDEALSRLAAKHPEKAELVKLRYFVGLTGDEAAAALGISPATADRYWTYARAWLARELSPDSARES
jgi:RNA polymerase sigma factor (sigma-70 family)